MNINSKNNTSIQSLKIKTQSMKKQFQSNPNSVSLKNVNKNQQELIKEMSKLIGSGNDKLSKLYQKLQSVELEKNKALQESISRQTVLEQQIQNVEKKCSDLIQQKNSIIMDFQDKSLLKQSQVSQLSRVKSELQSKLMDLNSQKKQMMQELLKEQQTQKGIGLDTIEGMLAQFILNIMQSENDKTHFQSRIEQESGQISKQIEEAVQQFTGYYNTSKTNNTVKQQQKDLLSKISNYFNNNINVEQFGQKKLLMYSSLIYLSQFTQENKTGSVSITVKQIKYIYKTLELLQKFNSTLNSSKKSSIILKNYYDKIKSLNISDSESQSEIDEQYSQIIVVLMAQPPSEAFKAIQTLSEQYNSIESEDYTGKKEQLLIILKKIFEKQKKMYNIGMQLKGMNLIEFQKYNEINEATKKIYEELQIPLGVQSSSNSKLQNISNAPGDLRGFISNNSVLTSENIQMKKDSKNISINTKFQILTNDKKNLCAFIDNINKNIRVIEQGYFDFNFLVKQIDQKIKRIPSVLIHINYKQYAGNPSEMKKVQPKLMQGLNTIQNRNNVIRRFKKESGRVLLTLDDKHPKKIDAQPLLNNIVQNTNYEKHLHGDNPNFQLQLINDGKITCHPKPLDQHRIVEVEKKVYDFENALNILENKTTQQLYTETIQIDEDDDESISIKKKLGQTIENGDNITLFGYGQSGSGKTFSLIDNTNKNPILKNDKTLNAGGLQKLECNVGCQTIMYQYVNDMIQMIKKGGGKGLSIFSIFEIYGLVQPAVEGVQKIKDADNQGFQYSTVPGKFSVYKKLVEHKEYSNKELQSANDLRKVYLKIDEIRRTKTFTVQATNNNNESSRSQLFIILRIDRGAGMKPGHAIFVDMAGIENSYDIFIENQHGKNIIEFLKETANVQFEMKGNVAKNLVGINNTNSYTEYVYNKVGEVSEYIRNQQFENIKQQVICENGNIEKILQENVQNVLLKKSLGDKVERVVGGKKQAITVDMKNTMDVFSSFKIFMKERYNTVKNIYEGLNTLQNLSQEDLYLLILYLIVDLFNPLIMSKYLVETSDSVSAIQDNSLIKVFQKYQQDIIIKQRTVQETILKAYRILGDKQEIHNDIYNLSKLFSYVMKSIKLLRLLNGNTKNNFVRIINVNRAPIVFMEGFFINESINQLKQLLKFKNIPPEQGDIIYDYMPSKYLNMGNLDGDRKNIFGVMNCIEFLASQKFDQSYNSSGQLIEQMRKLLGGGDQQLSLEVSKNIKQVQPEIFLLSLLDPMPETFDQQMGAFETLEFIQSIVSNETPEQQQQNVITRKTSNKFPFYSNVFFNLVSFLLSVNLFQNIQREVSKKSLTVNIPHRSLFELKTLKFLDGITGNGDKMADQEIKLDNIQKNYLNFISLVQFQFVCFGIIMFLYMQNIEYVQDIYSNKNNALSPKSPKSPKSVQSPKAKSGPAYMKYLLEQNSTNIMKALYISNRSKIQDKYTDYLTAIVNSFDSSKPSGELEGLIRLSSKSSKEIVSGTKGGQIGNLYSYMNMLLSSLFTIQNQSLIVEMPIFYNYMFKMFQSLFGQKPSTLEELNKNIYYVLYDIYSNPMSDRKLFNYFNKEIVEKSASGYKQLQSLLFSALGIRNSQYEYIMKCIQSNYGDIYSKYSLKYITESTEPTQRQQTPFFYLCKKNNIKDMSPQQCIADIYINQSKFLGYYFQEIFNIFDYNQKQIEDTMRFKVSF